MRVQSNVTSKNSRRRERKRKSTDRTASAALGGKRGGERSTEMDPEQERPSPLALGPFHYARDPASEIAGALTKLGVKCVNETVIRGMELSRDKSHSCYISKFLSRRRNFCLNFLAPPLTLNISSPP